MIYLDHNATTPLDSRVQDAMQPYLSGLFGNPSSLYRAGRVTRSAIESAREQVAALVGVQPAQVIFTSGGTEANNLAIKGVAATMDPGVVAYSVIEHPSVLDTATSLQRHGWSLLPVSVDEDGLVTDADNAIIKARPRLLSIMLANNETGAVQPVGAWAERIKACGCLVHTDAVQAVGKIPVDFGELNVDLMSLSGHKIYGPKGVGALVFDKAVKLEPLLSGGGQEHGYRAGTENVAAIVGFGKAAELARVELSDRMQHLERLKRRLSQGLKGLEKITIFSERTERLVNTTQFGISQTDGEMLLMQLDKKGFAVSSGSACASGGGQPSHVLLAMAVESGLAKSALRVSLGQSNTGDDVDRFIAALTAIVA